MFKYMAVSDYAIPEMIARSNQSPRQWSFANYEQSLPDVASENLAYRVASWLYNTSLFEEAWYIVCSHPFNWWWSEQLCTFTAGVWTAFIAIEGMA